MILCLYWAKHKFEGIWLIGVKGQYIETSWNHSSFTGLTYSYIAATTWSLLLEVKISSSTKSSVWVANFCVRSYNWSVLPSSGRQGWRGSCQAGGSLGRIWFLNNIMTLDHLSHGIEKCLRSLRHLSIFPSPVSSRCPGHQRFSWADSWEDGDVSFGCGTLYGILHGTAPWVKHRTVLWLFKVSKK